MVTVVVRQSVEETGTVIGQFKPEEIDSIVETFKKYGAYDSENSLKFDSASWALNSDGPVFEIIVEFDR